MARTADPLIVTLILDEASQARLDALRAAHFPPERNHLAAHVTLFHALPGDELGAVDDDVRAVADRPGFDVRVAGVRHLGRGVALELESADLLVVRDELAGRWAPWLTAQDRQRFRPHVTVQNKVDPATSKALYADLAAAHRPWAARATGLAVWHYRGGPWEPAGRHRFTTPGGAPGSSAPPAPGRA